MKYITSLAREFSKNRISNIQMISLKGGKNKKIKIYQSNSGGNGGAGGNSGDKCPPPFG